MWVASCCCLVCLVCLGVLEAHCKCNTYLISTRKLALHQAPAQIVCQSINSCTLGFKTHTVLAPPALTVDQGDAAEAEGSLGAGATVVMSWMLA